MSVFQTKNQTKKNKFSDDELLRYSRQILLPNIDIEGQLKLANAKILILGCGGLGCASAMYLAAAGVGRMRLMDFDEVDLSNLQRQIAFDQDNIGGLKAEVLADKLGKLNANIDIDFITTKAVEHTLLEALAGFDLILDGSDNFSTRFMVNRCAFQLGIKLVSAAAIGFQGQLCSFDSVEETSPCYQCLYPSDALETEQNCHSAGVVSPIVGMLGSMQALETIKILLGLENNLIGKLMVCDGLNWEQRIITVPKDASCDVCSFDSSRV